MKLSYNQTPLVSPYDTTERSARRTPRKKEVERRQQLDIENWLKNKFREGFFNMREAFEDKDPERSGVVCAMFSTHEVTFCANDKHSVLVLSFTNDEHGLM